MCPLASGSALPTVTLLVPILWSAMRAGEAVSLHAPTGAPGHFHRENASTHVKNGAPVFARDVRLVILVFCVLFFFLSGPPTEAYRLVTKGLRKTGEVVYDFGVAAENMTAEATEVRMRGCHDPLRRYTRSPLRLSTPRGAFF